MRTIIIISLLLTSTLVFAGVKEKKALRDSEETMKSGIEAVVKACGNASLEASIDWSAWDTYDYDKVLRKKKEEIIGYVGGLINSVYQDMATLCGSDKDYKAELAKLTKLKFSGKKDPKEYYVAFKVKGTDFDITLNGDGVGSWKNAELLKAAFE